MIFPKYNYKKLNFNLPITREHLDLNIYQLKFKICDTFLSSSELNVELLRQLLLDKATFAYLNFLLNGSRFKCYPYQDLILNDSYRFKYFRAANQIGKSFLLVVKGAINLLIDHGFAHNEAIISKSLPQSTFQMQRIKFLLNSMPHLNFIEEKGGVDNYSVITVEIKNNKGKVKYINTLICAPCTEGALGYDLHEVNLDEFEFWETDQEYFYNQIAEPRTYATNGKLTIFSNPNGQDNFGAKLEQMTLPDGSKKFHTYIFNYLDMPGHTIHDLELAEIGKSRQQIESTLLAVRSSGDRNYFSPDEIEESYDSNLTELNMVGKQPYFFLDVGSKIDRSVLVGGYVEKHKDYELNNLLELFIPIIHIYPVGYPISRVAGVNIDEDDGWHYEKSVKDYILEWSNAGIVPILGFDVTGNAGMKALFESIHIDAIDVTFSGPNKSGYYQRFKYLMEKRLLHRIKCEDWRDEASQLVVTKSVRGYLLINSGGTKTSAEKKRTIAQKKIPDDCMDATAGLIYLSNNPEYIPYSLEVFKHADKNKI